MTPGARVGETRKSSTATGFSIMENDPEQSTTNDTTKGVDNLGASSSTSVGFLTVIDETSSTSDDISHRNSSLEHHNQLLVVQQNLKIIEHS